MSTHVIQERHLFLNLPQMWDAKKALDIEKADGGDILPRRE